jgi:homoserine dehydrogenase
VSDGVGVGSGDCEIRLALVGFGGVGIAFAQAVAESRSRLLERYAVAPRVAGIRTSSRQVVSPPDDPPPSEDWDDVMPLPEFLRATRATMVVQCIPSDAARAATAFEQVVTALDAGLDVVTATKSHLVTRWAELDALARRHERRIRISAAAGAALPAVDLARRAVRAFDCGRVRASLNGTSNFVLNQVMEGRTVQSAIADAQEVGIAEPDPAYDLSGRDAASKLVLLANLLWSEARTLIDVDVSGIDAATGAWAREAMARGRHLRSMGEADRRGRLSVSVQEVADDDAFFRLPGAEKLVEFECGEAGTITVSGGKSSRRGAALALLKDVVNLGSGDLGLGFD